MRRDLDAMASDGIRVLGVASGDVERQPDVLESGQSRDQVECLEKQIVKNTLTRNRWNQSRTAEDLGLSRVGLANKVRRYNLTEVD